MRADPPVERLALNPAPSIDVAKAELVSEINHDRDYPGDWDRCSSLERLLLSNIAVFETTFEPYRVGTREIFARSLGVAEVPVSTVQSALRNLSRRSLIFKPEGRSNYEIEDPMFREWVLTEQLPPTNAIPSE